MAYCSKCGTQLSDGTKFCPKCGTPCDDILVDTTNDTEINELLEQEQGETKRRFMKYLYIFGAIVVLGLIGYFYSKDSISGDDSAVTNLTSVESTAVDGVNPEKETICAFKDIVEFQNVIQGCSGLTSQAKGNYQKARPSIEAIAKRNGFTIYEYHYINGDLGQGEMSTYCCYLYKNCTISKDETGSPTFTPYSNGVCCVLSDGEITVYDRGSYDELIRLIKEQCENKLYSETEGDGEESHFYSDGKYCYYIDCISSVEYRIPIRKQVEDNYEVIETNDLDWLQGHWVYEGQGIKGHVIIQGDRLKVWSNMNPEPIEKSYRINGDEINAGLIDGMDLFFKIDFDNHRIDYGNGNWMRKVD